MSIVLKIFLTFFTDLSFYTKHTFHFIYVNQVIHIVILVDNVDNFVYNLIISGFADFCHVENFLESFSLIHHDSTGFVHFARIVFFNPIMPAIARSQADIRQADIRNPLRYVALHQGESTKTTCGFFSSNFFRHTTRPIQKGQVVWLLLCKKSTLCFPHLISIRF